MKTRRHHNNRGDRLIRSGKLPSQAEQLARELLSPEPSRGTKMVAVFDLDGVLANDGERYSRYFTADSRLTREERYQMLYGEKANFTSDRPILKGLRCARNAARTCHVVYLSARPDICQAQTEGWLRAHDAPQGQVILRPGKWSVASEMSNAEWKLGELRNIERETGPISFFMDDDSRNVFTAARAGYTALFPWEQHHPAARG